MAQATIGCLRTKTSTRSRRYGLHADHSFCGDWPAMTSWLHTTARYTRVGHPYMQTMEHAGVCSQRWAQRCC